MLKNFAIVSNFIDFLLLIVLAFVLTVSILLFLDTRSSQSAGEPSVDFQELQTRQKPDFALSNKWSANNSLLSNRSQVNLNWLNPFSSFNYFKNCIYLPSDHDTTTVQCWFSMFPYFDTLRFWLIENTTNQSRSSNTSLIGQQVINLTDQFNKSNKVANGTDQVGKVNLIKNVTVHFDKIN